MKILKSYKAGWKASLNSKALITTVYIIQMAMALLLVIPFYALFNSITGNSMLADNLVSGFDATALGEFLRSGGDALRFYIKAFLPWVILFALTGVFFQGGIISWISNFRGRFTLSAFLSYCTKWFWPFLKAFFYTFIIQLILAIMVYLPIALIVGRENLTDEYIGRTVITGVVIHLILISWGIMLAEFTRLMLFRNSSRKVLRTFWTALKFCIRRVFSLFGIYLLWMIIPLALIVIYYFVRMNWAVDTALMVLSLFLFQQVFIWLRTGLRIQRTGMFYRYLVLDSLKG